MFISPGTVKVHLSHIVVKLGIFSRAQVAAEGSVALTGDNASTTL